MSNWIKPRLDASRALWANDSEKAVRQRLGLYDLNDKEKEEVIDTAKTINKWYDRMAHTATTLAGAGIGVGIGHAVGNDPVAALLGGILGGGLGYVAYDPLQKLNREYLYTGDPTHHGNILAQAIPFV